jgi:hypothetical protein
MDKITLIRRNKAKNIGKYKTFFSFRKRIISERGEFCEDCGKKTTARLLEADHIIPIPIGGEQFSSKNIKLRCCVCHGKKSGIDRTIVHLYKKLGILRKEGSEVWFLSIDREKSISLYEEIIKLHEESKLNKSYL